MDGRRFVRWIAWGCVLAVLDVGCGRKETQRTTEASPKAPSPESDASSAPRGALDPGNAPEEPLWPDPLPVGWKMLNDYEAPLEGRKTLWGGFFDTWGFRGGKCRLSQVEEGGSRRLRVEFALPLANSQCGTFEYLAGERGKPREVDIRPYRSVVFLLKSGDESEHRVRLEVTELDPYDAALQGYVGESRPLVAGREWTRYEVRLDDILHPMFDRSKGKQVGIRLDRKDQGGPSGVILMDNLAFVGKDAP